MKPLDLTQQPPRSCYEELDGLIFMPRTIDKLRGLLPGGNPGDYFINGQIPGMSGYLLERLGITEEALFEVVARARDEGEIAAWLRERTDAAQYPVINEEIRRSRPRHAKDPAYFAELYAPTLALHPDLERILDIIDADDRRIFGTPA
ncbi:MAG TPA: DUF5069 domain-containing protein [Candidatus Baltobacteraceae bacterium]|nr:DUF5069 domain-containing protein [Candidatus Baltobacteraceae bacterium]